MTKIKIALASDHAGYELKLRVMPLLRELGYEAVDLGCGPEGKANYVLFAERAARAVQEGSCRFGILLCGTGLGMAIVANKLRGVRATPCWDERTARLSRSHNDANCLALGARITTPELALDIVRAWLETEFEGGRHAERLASLSELEERICSSLHRP